MRTILIEGKTVYAVSIRYNKKTHNLGTYTTYRRAKVIADRAYYAMQNGERIVYAIKRKHKHAPLRRVAINLDKALS